MTNNDNPVVDNKQVPMELERLGSALSSLKKETEFLRNKLDTVMLIHVTESEAEISEKEEELCELADRIRDSRKEVYSILGIVEVMRDYLEV